MFAIKDSFVVGILYLSAIIGAGFATGREIMTFFGCYGYKGFVGLAIACFLIIFCGAKALIMVKEQAIDNPHELNVAIGGKNGGKAITLICGLFAYSAYIIGAAPRTIPGCPLFASLIISIPKHLI